MQGKIKKDSSILIVGIGASAGGLESFKKFFSNVPVDSGMAFVLVPHLDPTRESILTDLIMEYTSMNAFQAVDDMKIEPNTIYIIPPNANMTLANGRLKLSPPTAPRGLRTPIDHFFRSLAKEQGDLSICVLFSGTGTDGTLGIREINGVGGMVIVQDPSSAEYDGMLKSAIQNALVDYVVPPSEMAEKLVSYVQKRQNVKKKEYKIDTPSVMNSIKDLLDLLRDQTGHDFTSYKENTLLRRMERRLTINQLHAFPDYIELVKKNKKELDILFKELLIGVTNFFRDREAFDLLEEKVLPTLFKGDLANKPLRIWVPGCSTGEEAYSIAILVHEFLEKSGKKKKIQIFASDIDETSMERARTGVYPDNIAADVPSLLLKKYFKAEGNYYKIKKNIRECIIFAVHDVLSDPPFSKMDLISCRNLLIYLKPAIQNDLMVLFHYALNPKGYMLLGNSETITGSSNLFLCINPKWKLFQRNDATPAILNIS
ncbi:MAG: hypothetical protein JW891_00305 [Candidatus Lokiarchaeota archaeon]|nr:hypothetical protein [Candidatus Lokiarchaeota archaeon]